MATTTPARAAASTALAVGDLLPEWALKPLERFLNNPNFELLLPAIPVNSKLGFGYDLSVSVVQIDPNPINREVFKVGTRDGQELFAYSKPALEKMASAAGISIGPTRRMDPGSDQDFCHMGVSGMMKNESGQPILRSASKAHYMPHVIESALQEKRKYNPGKPDSELMPLVAGEMAQFRRHLIARTETGAILRLVRQFLAVKSALTKEQIAKPKVLLRVDWRPDVSDPETKRFLLEQGARGAMALYGPEARRLEGPASDVSAAAVIEEEDPETREAMAAYSAAPITVPAAPSPQESAKNLFEEACAGLGLGFVEAADILTASGNDYAKAAQAIERMANEKAAGE